MRTFILTAGLCVLVGLVLVGTAPEALADDICGCCGQPVKAKPAKCPECKPYPCCECTKPKKPKCPPKYNNRRFLENWRPCLCVPYCEKGDWSDRLKAMRLTKRGNIWVDVGGQVRFRFESFNNVGFSQPNDDSWMLARVRLHTDIHFGDHLRVFIEGIYADQVENRVLPGGPRAIDINQGDLQNAFVEAKGPVFGCYEAGVYGGRRELQFGKQRLVSPLDWANTRRTFDGAGVWAKRGEHHVDAFISWPVVVRRNQLDEWFVGDRLFWGLNYKNTRLTCVTWEGYFYTLNDNRNATSQDRYTVGGLVYGKIPNTRFNYEAEGAYQFGHVPGDTISAGMFSGVFGWSPCIAWTPRFELGLDYASGDPNGSPTQAGTFNPLFDLAHKYLGHADLIARKNLLAGQVAMHLHPTSKLTLSVWWHAFFRANTADAAYRVPGAVLRAAGGNTSRDIGSEIDLMLKYKVDRHWTVAFEYAHFFTGDFINQTGPSADTDFWWVGATGTF